MIDERRAFIIRFREIADKLSNIEPQGYRRDRLLSDAGRLLMEVHDRGFLVLPGLGKLVDLVRAPRSVRARRFYPPARLFRDVAGYNKRRLALNDDGKYDYTGEVGDSRVPGGILNDDGKDDYTDEPENGLLPWLLHDSSAIPRPRKGYRVWEQDKITVERFAFTCRLLADCIEKWNPADTRDAWIYEQDMLGKTRQWVLDNIPDWCPDREQVTTINGIKKCSKRYAEKNHLPLPEKRRPGAPRKKWN